MKKSKKYPAWRPDRVCLKHCNYKAVSIERIGMDPIPFFNNKEITD
jgi:hypothetical protein